MYITRIELKNIRCFEKLDIDLKANIGTKRWAIILGDNGVGKTTLLRAIAMGLNDASGVSALLSELYGKWIRERCREGDSTISIHLADLEKPDIRFSITTTIKETSAGNYNVEQATEPKEVFPWDNIFVCGYGAARRAYGTKDYSEYSGVDATYTLFNYDAPLQNPELMLRRIKDSKKEDTLDELLKAIDKILMLPKGSTQLGSGGITISGTWGNFMPLGSLGDGYQATLAWIVDVFGWALFYDSQMVQQGLSGILLLDELEQHLHPRWQRSIISLLRAQFPNLQFITTSHSPLCASGAADLNDDDYILYLLKMKAECLVDGFQLPTLRGYRADQVLTSEAFGLSTTRNPEIEGKMAKLRELMLIEKRTAEQDAELAILGDYLKNEIPSAAESEEVRRVQEETHRLLTEIEARLNNDEGDK